MSTLTAKYKDHYVLFLEAGFIAVNQADEISATRLFAAARMLNPKSVLNDIGMGYLHLNKLEIKKAISYFESALKIEPNNEMAKAFLGMAKVFSTDQVKEGHHILETLKESKDPAMKTFSKSSLEFVDKFMKKPVSQ
jgi:tetratricopeptide (TPR) repeat protein